MKKLTLSVIVLLLLGGIANAADKTEMTVKSQVENRADFSSNMAVIPAMKYEIMLEENTQLKIQTAELTRNMENLQDKLGYTQMMHATLSNLQETAIRNVEEDAKSQLDYARMMHTTLINLNSLLK